MSPLSADLTRRRGSRREYSHADTYVHDAVVLVQGDYALGGCRAGLRPGRAMYAIPRQAVKRQLHDGLVLRTTLSAAQARWLMHATLMKGA